MSKKSNNKLFIGIAIIAIIVGIFATISSKQKAVGSQEEFAKIGNKTYTMGEYRSFEAMIYNFPDLARKGFFPGKRLVPSLFIETEILYPEAKKYEKSVKNTKEWEWKETFNLGQYYQRQVIRLNMGATDKELEEYFKKHRANILQNSQNSDTSFNANRIAVIDSVFISKYPPTKDFIAKYRVQGDQNFINKKWLEQNKKIATTFFTHEYYVEKYGKKYPKDINELLGTDKIITPEDFEIIKNWLPESTQEKLNNPKTKMDVVTYMIGWKLFAEEAVDKGLNKDLAFKQQQQFFEKFDIVRYYLNNVLTDRLGADRNSVNRDIAKYIYWDKVGTVTETIDSSFYNKVIDSIVQMKTDAALLKYISDKRANYTIEVINHNLTDGMAESSEKLSFEADSLVKDNNSEKAMSLYLKLANNYSFTEEGIKAYRALALIYNDLHQYKNAINSYGNYLVLSEESDEWSKVFFMRGYIYSENLHKLALAAVNYKWLIKNKPDSDLVDDAEFMYLHLGEPMDDIEELKAESRRQGRKPTLN